MSEYFKPNNDIDLNKLYPLAKTIEGVPYYPFKSSFTIPDLKETITSYGSGFYFDPQFSEKFGIENFNLQSTHFTERPDWRVGREESYHGVTFGELELTINQGNDEEEIVVPIAIKPFFSNDKNEAIHEYLALKLINQYPTIQTFKPIGLFVNEWLTNKKDCMEKRNIQLLNGKNLTLTKNIYFKGILSSIIESSSMTSTLISLTVVLKEPKLNFLI